MPLRRINERFSHRISHHYGRLIAILFLLLAALLSWVSLQQIRQHELQAAGVALQGINKVTVQMLQRQSQEAIAETISLSTNTPVHSQLLKLLHHAGSSEDRFLLRRELAAWLVSHEFRDFYLLNATGTIMAGFREADQGKSLDPALIGVLTDTLHGEGLISHPVMIANDVQMWLMVPVYDQTGKKAGVFAVLLAKQRHFGRTASLAQFGASTETYLVDRQGQMMTTSRFETELVSMGRLQPGQSSVLNVPVTEPQSGQPTYAVAHMLDGPDGMNLEGYPDYRGNHVIGVWQWDRLFDAAVISEMDVDEALAGYRQTRDLVVLLLAGLMLAGLVVARTYTHYRRTQEREANDLRNLLLESTAEAIYGVDLQGRCNFANKTCVRMLGHEDAADLHGRNMHQLLQHSHVDGSPYDEQASRIFRSFHNKTRIHCRDEVFWRRDGSSFPVEFWSHPMFDDEGEVIGCVVTFWDISELRKAEKQRTQIEKQIQHTQRLESMGVLAGGIAHDFNNILSAILGNAALASRKVISDPLDAREKLEKVVQSCDRAAVLCRQMLAYSGKGKFVIHHINLSAMVEEITHLLEVSLDKGVFIKYALTDTLPMVEADEAQMQQLIMNLVTNANEAIGGHSGVISITTGVMHADAEYLMDCYGDNPASGRYVYVEVSDTGCGMDTATQQKIFDPFFTTKFTGRGLGMSAVLGIVRGHDGALKLYSEQGKGTTFKFLLPASDGLADADEQAQEAEDRWQGHGLVLVVDDEETVREIAMMMLEDMGFSTLGVTNGVEALAVYREHRQEIAVVLMDLTMPKMGGEECFRELRRINPDIKVVLSSGYNEQDAVQTFTGKKLAGFIQKPVSPDRLKKAMHTALGDNHA